MKQESEGRRQSQQSVAAASNDACVETQLHWVPLHFGAFLRYCCRHYGCVFSLTGRRFVNVRMYTCVFACARLHFVILWHLVASLLEVLVISKALGTEVWKKVWDP